MSIMVDDEANVVFLSFPLTINKINDHWVFYPNSPIPDLSLACAMMVADR
jgi:hypothetical protein